jgi:transcriptional regulator with XRE-family HTH domain
MSEVSQAFAVVNYLLNNKGMTKDEIAAAAGVSRRMIDYTLVGEGKQIGNKAVARIAAALNIPLHQFVSAALAEASDFPAYDDLVFVRKMNARPRGGRRRAGKRRRLQYALQFPARLDKRQRQPGQHAPV